MTAAGDLVAKLCGRLVLGFAALLLGWPVAPATARTLDIDRDVCNAMSGTALPDKSLPALRFSCRGSPAGYQRDSLWLRAPLDDAAAQRVAPSA